MNDPESYEVVCPVCSYSHLFQTKRESDRAWASWIKAIRDIAIKGINYQATKIWR